VNRVYSHFAAIVNEMQKRWVTGNEQAVEATGLENETELNGS
jgi:hypothetical protein